MTTETAFTGFVKKLAAIYEEREAAGIADWVFEKITGKNKSVRRIWREAEMDPSETEQLENCLLQLLEHKPVQYVLQESWFYRMKLHVDERVLIPRPETEELVEWILNDYAGTPPLGAHRQVIDIGTGSGCIAIALKKNWTKSGLTAIDASSSALEVAKKNGEMQQAEVRWLLLDFLEDKNWAQLGRFDVIASNPPYIPVGEKKSLAKNVTRYEPSTALFVPDEEPLVFYKKIASFARHHLNEGGTIYVEVHEELGQFAAKVFESAGFKTVTRNDIYGRRRMVKAWKEPIS